MPPRLQLQTVVTEGQVIGNHDPVGYVTRALDIPFHWLGFGVDPALAFKGFAAFQSDAITGFRPGISMRQAKLELQRIAVPGDHNRLDAALKKKLPALAQGVVEIVHAFYRGS